MEAPSGAETMLSPVQTDRLFKAMLFAFVILSIVRVIC